MRGKREHALKRNARRKEGQIWRNGNHGEMERNIREMEVVKNEEQN